MPYGPSSGPPSGPSSGLASTHLGLGATVPGFTVRFPTLGEELVIPINHFSVSYTCDDETLRRLRDGNRIVLRYLDNPNGSIDDIAGIANEAGNVVGLMPHPERACDPLMGSTEGLGIFESMLTAIPALTK